MISFTRTLHRLSTIVRWVFGGFCLLIGFFGMIADNITAGLFLVALGLLIAPLSNRYLFNRLKWKAPVFVKVILGFVLLIGFGMTISPTKPTIKAIASPTNKSPINIEVEYNSGGTIRLYLNDKVVGEKQTDNNKKVVFKNIKLIEGDNNLKAVVIDNESKSISKKIIYDTKPPDKPHVSNLTNEVYDKNLKINGTSETNSTVNIYFNDNLVRTIKINDKGEFSAKFILYNDKNSFQFEAIDEAGNSSKLTNKIETVYVDKNKSEEEKAKAKQEAEKIAKLETERTQKEKEEEASLKKEKELEEKKFELATQYCEERKDTDRLYITGITIENNEEKLHTDKSKKGSNLTLDECKEIVNILLRFRHEDITKISDDTKDIIEGKGSIGMSKTELLLSYGVPNDINTTTSFWGVNEQWVYNKNIYGISAIYVYLDNNKVTSYQDF